MKISNTLLAGLHSDEQGDQSISTIMVLAVAVLVLYGVGSVAGLGAEAKDDGNTMIGIMWTMAKTWLFKGAGA